MNVEGGRPVRLKESLPAAFASYYLMSKSIQPGVWKMTFGRPEAISPLRTVRFAPAKKGLKKLPVVDLPPIAAEQIAFQRTTRGLVLEFPLAAGEEIYGLGLQLKSFRQTRKQKMMRANSDPVADTGDSHAPVPFYVSTAGYAVLIDTARYASFYCGSHQKTADIPDLPPSTGEKIVATSVEELYGVGRMQAARNMIVEVPHAPGVSVYLFAGPTMLDAIRRYVLFSGGGALPPMWGLGIWYRCYAKFNQEETLELARSFREANLPCDVLGLEPGWQTKSYSCSFVWDRQSFPAPEKMTADLADSGYKLNLWEHAFVHPTSPLHAPLKDGSGDYAVWEGLVPDFSLASTRDLFSKYHEETFVQQGIAGFKLDECDNSNFIPQPWSFPEHSRFPGGADGEQMHSLFGLLYQQAILDPFRRRNLRTFSEVRNSHLLAASLPFVLYSDLYDQSDFLRGLVNSGFSGLLWSPEVRSCESVEDLIRRVQSVVLSPQALINAWMIPNPPWQQFDLQKNIAGEPLENWKEVEAQIRRIFEFRMSLLPLLYRAFASYHFDGTPPFRALVVDWPDDPECHDVDNQYLIGDTLMAAPVLTGQRQRRVYFPKGRWYDFQSHAAYEGAQWVELQTPLEYMPVFVRDQTLLPLAKPVPFVARDTVLEVTVRVYGNAPQPFSLYVDDGVSFDYEKGVFGSMELSWTPERQGTVVRRGRKLAERYRVTGWEKVA